MKVVFLGLSITSSWGNGHATTFRGLVRGLDKLGHEVLFLERDVPWYAGNRDMPEPPWGRTELYGSLKELKSRHAADVREADVVVVGSYVPEGVEVGNWVASTARGLTAFYDIDTPITLAKLEAGDEEYLSPDLIPKYNLYLSFTGGPLLERLVSRWGARRARPLYCSFDPDVYFPEKRKLKWDMGYLGTYSDDRQPKLENLMLQAARERPDGQFVVAGPQYPKDIVWPENVKRVNHIPPAQHRDFYNSQRFTLNITRDEMVAVGYCPSVRLFEAAACGIPIISDYWPGLGSVLELGKEVLISRNAADTMQYLQEMTDDQRTQMGERARARVLAEHTSHHRAQELEQHVVEAMRREPAHVV